MWTRRRSSTSAHRSHVKHWDVFKDDPGAAYCHDAEYDLATMEPMVAKPALAGQQGHRPQLPGQKLDQAYMGSCTGGKITDMIFAASILKGNKVKIPTYVVPGSTEVHPT